MPEETIGTRIASLRSQYSYSQEYVADQLGVSRQAVSKWEQNQSSPDTENLIALSQLFNVSVEYLAIGKIQEIINTSETQKSQKSTQKVVGYILLSTGLVSLLLGIIIDFVLVIISAYFILSGIVCLFAKKHFLIIMFFALALVTLIASIFSSHSLVRLALRESNPFGLKWKTACLTALKKLDNSLIACTFSPCNPTCFLI